MNIKTRHLFVFLTLLVFTSVVHAYPANAATQGWQPSEKQKAAAVNMSQKFLGTLHSGDLERSYAMLAPASQKMIPFVVWQKMHPSLHKKDEINYSDIRVTWYNDPPSSRIAGVYAAFDLYGQHQDLSMCHEIVILHEQPDASFRVMRYEHNIIDKTVIEQLSKDKQTKK